MEKAGGRWLFSKINRIFANRLTPHTPEIHQNINGYVRKIKEHLQQELAEIKAAGLYKSERVITSPQRAEIEVAGRKVLNFCANNYLGLSDNPRLIEAAKKPWTTAATACRRCASSAAARTSTRSSKRPLPTTSARRTRFSTPPVSMPTGVSSNRSSANRTPSSQTP